MFNPLFNKKVQDNTAKAFLNLISLPVSGHFTKDVINST